MGLLQLRRSIGRAVFAFSGRRGGVSPPPYASLNLGLHVGDAEEAVRENRRRALHALGLAPGRLVEAEQIHETEVAVVSESVLSEHLGERYVAAGADAVVTSLPGVALSLYFADCVPVFLADRTGRAVGLAHAGWRGTAHGVAAATVRVMCTQFDLVPSELVAVIGPCVGACCYEVDEEVAERVAASLPPGADVAAMARCTSTPSKWSLNLANANVAQLEAAGVPGGAIDLTGRCTCCEREAFFSVRGDGRTTGRCGAFAYVTAAGSDAASGTSRDA